MSFLASCLGVPDMFESNSANSVGDLHVLLTEEATVPVMNGLLRDLADELDKQDYLHDVSFFLDFDNICCLFVFFSGRITAR